MASTRTSIGRLIPPRSSLGEGKRWRWVAVGVATAALAALPATISALPTSAPEIPADALLQRIVASEAVPFRGYAESTGALALPDVPQVGRLGDLFAQTTRLRVWVTSPTRWRVDELLSAAERGTYMDATGLWLWDSARRTATRIDGHPSVRLPRAADLLPPALGRLVAQAASETEVTALTARRIAGVAAAGLRIVPTSSTTTVGRVDLWADVSSGLPLRVEIYPRGSQDPVLSSSFLDVTLAPPQRPITRFRLPRGAMLNYRSVTDFAHEVNEASPYVLPEELGGMTRATSVTRAAGTYGEGFDRVSVLALPSHLSPERADALDSAPVVSRSWGSARVLETPLVNTLFFTYGHAAFIVSGPVTTDVLEEVAADLTALATEAAL
ncbi:MAG: hypothetical protein M3N53_03750 [Actinomycetota bacterium]|nr:hypothetical protein [Actinomycetota bacterium]